MNTTKNWQRSIVGVVAVAAALLAGCSDDGGSDTSDTTADTTAQTATIVEACMSVGGTLTQLSGETWDCGEIPEPNEVEYTQITDFLAPFCPEPMGYSNGFTSTEPPTMGWSCWVAEEEAAATAEGVCAQADGAFEAFSDLEWTCRDVTMVDDSTYGNVDEALLPYCPPPLGLTNGQLSSEPLQYGWSCSVMTLTDDITLAQACEFIAGTLETSDGGAWRCTDVPLANDGSYSLVQDFLAPRCQPPMEYTSGSLGDNPPLAGWSCSVPA
ncbi:MAG: hypothetical protein Q7V57_11900 [Actinomycetota bacterium]|nr:hypothetical protein [Actinomycetota bacterium]